MVSLKRFLISPSGIDNHVGLLILRLWAGCALALAHGIGKITDLASFNAKVGAMGFPLPWLTGTFAALSESLGGLLLALGLATRPASAAILATMLGAGLWVHRNDPFMNRELSLTYATVALALLFTGPGRLSVDAALRRR